MAVYKPKGVSSNKIVVTIRNILQASLNQPGFSNPTDKKTKVKVGHGGTLDPMAEGVLVLGIGKGTKLLDEYLKGSKTYLASGLLGVETDTLDATGKSIEEKPFAHVTMSMLQDALNKFTCTFDQMPPMYSALKKDGKPLYVYARQGIDIERKARSGLVSGYSY